MDIKLILGVTIMGILLIFLGWTGNDAYRNYDNELQIRGLWFSNFYNYSEVEAYAYNRDSSGEWVCVNVNKDLTFEDIVETCTHEASHELFARKCTESPKVCIKLMEGMEQ